MGGLAAAATWADIEAAPDGSGRLTVHRSKTDQDGEGATLYLSRRTMTALAAIRQDAPDDARVFGLSGSQIARRIPVPGDGPFGQNRTSSIASGESIQFLVEIV